MKSILQINPNRIWRRYLFSVLCALIFSSNLLHAQGPTVQGTVVGSNNEPLPGVNVVIKGTSEGTVTDMQGRYTISVPNESSILVFSFLGYLNEEIAVGAQQTINVSLIEDITGLEEIIVIGYGGVKKKEITGAVARVDADDISRNVTSDLGDALQGQIAGVNVTNSGAPGESSDILIRGISTIGDNRPLYVIDGVPFEGDPKLNPAEIESVDILKDAASAAIYGARGAAGVILITTKRGKAGKLDVAFNGSYGVSQIASDAHIPLMNAQETTYFDLVQKRNSDYITDDQASLEIQKYEKSFQYDSDLRNNVFVDYAPTQDYNITVSGGNENLTYSVLAGYFDQKGVIINSHFTRVNMRANTTYNKGRWNISANVGMSQDNLDEEAGVIGQTLRYRPTQQDFEDVDNSGDPLLSTGGDEGNRINWVLNSVNVDDNTKTNTAYGNFNVTYEIIEGLSLQSILGINSRNAYQKVFNPYSQVLRFDTREEISNPTDSYVENFASRQYNTALDLNLKYQKSFGDHKLTAQAIYTVEQLEYESFYAKGESVLDNSIAVLDNTSLNPTASNTDKWGGNRDWEHRRIGTIGRVLYNYKGRYMLNVSGRYDASAKFSKEHRWGFFPSISGAWNMSEENFWSPIKSWANDAKLRLSRGTTGNENIDPYQYSATIEAGSDYGFGPESSLVQGVGLTQKTFANKNVKWETSVMWNAGLDLAFFKNRLLFTAEYYDTKKEDMLFPVTVPGSASGQDDVVTWLNIGDMTNKGYELSLGYKQRYSQFGFGVTAVYSANKNEITKMNIETAYLLMDDKGLISGATGSSQITALAPGYEVASFFVYETDGIADTDEKLAQYQRLQSSARKGDVIYKDINGDGQISSLDRTYVGSGLPDYTVGLILDCNYRNFDFSMQWYAAVGHEIMNGSKATAYGYGRHKDQIYSWSEANPETPIPAYRGDTKNHANFAGHTDLWLEDGSFLRLKNITLGYSFATPMLDKAKMSKLRLFVSAQNALTFTKYSGYDPEVGGQTKARGLDKSNYPIAAFYLLGLNLNF